MAVKSVIDIEVNDEAFQSFADTFAKYQEQLAKTPGTWGLVGKEAANQRKSFEAIAAALLAQNDLARKRAAAEKESADRSKQQVNYWHELARTTKSVAGNIRDATASLLKWSVVTTAVGGLLGAGGLWGIDRLAIGAAVGRRQALGLGTTYGQQQAFDINYGRLVDPGQFLSGVNQALHDVSQRYLLSAAGLSGDLTGKSTTEVGSLLLTQLKALADRTPSGALAQVLQARGLDQFISLQDFERLKNTSPDEFRGLQRGFAQDVRTFAMKDRDLKAWQDFVTQLSRAGTTMETALLPALRPIADAFSKLSDAVAKTLSGFVQSDAFSQWVKVAETGIENFAKFIVSAEFQNDLKVFETGIAAAGHAVYDFLKFMGYIKGPQTPRQVAASKASTWDVILSSFGIGGYHPEIGGKYVAQPKSFNDLLNNIYGAESNFGRNARPSSKGALGPFQIMPSTFNQYSALGEFDPNDYGTARTVAGRILQDYLKEFHGDARKAVAAYNAGPGAVARDIRAHHGQWEQFLPGETKAYLKKVFQQAKSGVNVTIMNNSGGNAVVSTAQVAR